MSDAIGGFAFSDKDLGHSMASMQAQAMGQYLSQSISSGSSLDASAGAGLSFDIKAINAKLGTNISASASDSETINTMTTTYQSTYDAINAMDISTSEKISMWNNFSAGNMAAVMEASGDTKGERLANVVAGNVDGVVPDTSELSRIRIITEGEFARKSLHQITENDLQAFMLELKTARNIDTSTMNRYRARLMAIFHYAIKGKLINFNPAVDLRHYQEQARTRVLEEAEIKALLRYAKESKSQSLYLIVAIALYTGMRQGEVLGLEVQNIQDGYIRLDGRRTKSGYTRIVPIHQVLATLLDAYIKQNQCEDKLFLIKSIKTAFKTAVKRACIKDFRFHDLRRTSATIMKDQNSNVHAVSSILGHCSLSMTEKYLVSNYKQMEQAINTIPDYISNENID